MPTPVVAVTSVAAVVCEPMHGGVGSLAPFALIAAVAALGPVLVACLVPLALGVALVVVHLARRRPPADGVVPDSMEFPGSFKAFRDGGPRRGGELGVVCAPPQPPCGASWRTRLFSGMSG